MGKFLGIEKRKNHLGEPTEFLLLQYAEGAKLYVPFTQSHLVSKYIGANELSPTLHTLEAVAGSDLRRIQKKP